MVCLCKTGVATRGPDLSQTGTKRSRALSPFFLSFYQVLLQQFFLLEPRQCPEYKPLPFSRSSSSSHSRHSKLSPTHTHLPLWASAPNARAAAVEARPHFLGCPYSPAHLALLHAHHTHPPPPYCRPPKRRPWQRWQRRRRP